METGLSHTTLILWVIGIQAFLLVLLIGFWFFRRSSQKKCVKVCRESFLARNRKVFSVAGSLLLLGTVLVATVYFFLFPEEEKHFDPHVRSLEMRSSPDLYSPEDEDTASYGAAPGSKGWLGSSSGKDGSRMRESIRKSIRGKSIAESKGTAPGNPVLHSYLHLINNWLTHQEVSQENVNRKSALFYDTLVADYGFSGKKSDVDQALSRALFPEKNKEVSFLTCGRLAKAAWGQSAVSIGGTTQIMNCFILQSTWSDRYFIRCVPREEPASFLEVHKAAFVFFGGVFESILYRNLTGQDLKDVLASEGLTQTVFDQFCLDSGFTPILSTGSRVSRKDLLSGISGDLFSTAVSADLQAATLQELNRNLLKACSAAGKNLFPDGRQTINERFEMEKVCLIPFH